MSDDIPKALQQPAAVKYGYWAFLAFWLLLAAFPLVWVILMSFKLPVDAFASNPFQVIFGTQTRNQEGISIADLLLFGAFVYALHKLYLTKIASGLGWVEHQSPSQAKAIFWVLAAVVMALLPFVARSISSVLPDGLATPIIGLTWSHYYSVWVENEFYQQFLNSLMVTAGVVTISLTVGTLAGYGLARSGSNLAFWLLIIALIFRALPHSVLVTGYLPPFLTSNEWLQPLWDFPVIGWFLSLWGENPPTLYGQPIAVIFVLVSINQPFTIWMLRSFFQNIPAELDEAALVDGCSRFEAFRRVIIPVMWPGVITTGLFSFLLAYNDYLVTSLLLDAQNQTMVPSIAQYFNRETTMTDQVEAIAAAVSITAPLFVLVMVFQRQLVSGLTAGAVKG